jgi:hypothetical protein
VAKNLDLDPDPHPGSGFSNSECHIFNEKVQILFDFCISLNNNNSKHMKKYYFEHTAFQFFAIFSRDSRDFLVYTHIEFCIRLQTLHASVQRMAKKSKHAFLFKKNVKKTKIVLPLPL